MSITKVGSSYNFIYNTKTGKLSTKDGSKNEFVDFCNGDVKGEDTETLNHFDEHTRYQFTRMLFAYGTGMTAECIGFGKIHRMNTKGWFIIGDIFPIL